MNKKLYVIIIVIGILIVSMYFLGRSMWVPVYTKMTGRKTVKEVIEKIEPINEKKLIEYFKEKNIKYIPEKIGLIGLKEEKLLELWAYNNERWMLVHKYPILAASGVSGPKLKEGDRQVPEGIYKIVGLNPNSSYHLSMKVNYPNEFDRKMARKDNRDNLGGNIFIHGKSASIGCLAVGDVAIEELFLLVNKVGLKNVEVLIAPMDLRVKEMDISVIDSDWYEQLYITIKNELNKFR